MKNNFTIPKEIPSDDINDGIYYLQVDNQVKAVKNQKIVYYSHYAELIVNKEGLESIAQINLKYNPVYQEIVLNSLLIHRGDKQIDKTKTAKITILQRESNLEEQLYDGKLTANIILDDVRVGDIIEYSYTKTGSNPVYKGIFNYDRYIQWSIPIHQQNVRVLWDKPNNLNTKVLNIDVDVKEKKIGNLKEYSIVINDNKLLYSNSQTPEWFQPYGVVYFYETNNWAEVAKWARSLYKDAFINGSEITKITDEINKDLTDKKDKIYATLNYVQTKIRYLGIEVGTNSHMPSPAKETLQRRYGDCKDKTVLFISILKKLGIEAYPALVHTETGNQLNKLPPSIDSFDHVIAKVILGNKVYWLDPTRSYQVGKLENIYQPDYGYALVVHKETDALELMPTNEHLSKLTIKDYFDLSSGTNKDVIYKSNTLYQGYNAEKHRYNVVSKGITKLQKQYLDFYTFYYSDIEAKMKFESIDNLKDGTISTNEKYLIKNFWTTDTKNKEYTAYLYAHSMYQYIPKPEQLKRNAPYEYSHPVNAQQTIEVKFPTDNWSFENEETIVENKYFYLKLDTTYDKSTRLLTLDYSYKSLTNQIAATDIKDYVKERKKANNLLDYGIVDYFEVDKETKETPVKTSIDSNEYDEAIMILILVLVYLFGFMYIIINWYIDEKDQPVFSDTIFYPVSFVKVLILSLTSYGIYSVYWFSKNFIYQKKKDSSSIMPIARGIFNLFWYYPLYKNLTTDSQQRFGENRVLTKQIAILFAFLFLVSDVLANIDDSAIHMILLLVFSSMLLLPFINYINDVNKLNLNAYNYNSRWLARHTVQVILFIPLVLLIIASETNIIPSGEIIPGNKLMKHDVKYMQRKGVFPAGEKIIYFYSDAFLMMRDDGNGFTNNHAFSYWVDDGKLNIENEKFNKIKEIEVTYGEDEDSNTIVKLIRNDETHFFLYLSQEKGLDKNFVKELKDRWNKSKDRS